MNEQFGKEYKLCSKIVIDELFTSGKKISSFPFSATYKLTELPNKSVSFQVVISAPKKIFKRAHDRNRIKRLVRECFRKNKNILEDFFNLPSNKQEQLALFLVYRHNEEIEFETLMSKMKKFLLTLTTAIEKHEESKN